MISSHFRWGVVSLSIFLVSCGSDSTTNNDHNGSDNMPSVTLSCTPGGSATCGETADGMSFYAAIFKDSTCEEVFSNEPDTDAVSSGTVSCTPAGCGSSFSSTNWIDEMTDADVTETATGSYALLAFIDVNDNFGATEDIDAGDVLFCKEVTIGASSGSFTLGDTDLLDLGS